MKDSPQLAEVKAQLGIDKVPSLVMIGESGKKQLYEGQFHSCFALHRLSISIELTGKLNYDGLHSFYSDAKSGRGKDEL